MNRMDELPETGFQVYNFVLKLYTCIYNILNRTDELPETGFQVYNFVLKLSGGSGGPTRALAILEPGIDDLYDI